MKRNAMRRNLRQSIVKSIGRYIAIVMIIALGASLFVGLLMTKSDMVATGQRFIEEQNMFDLRLMNSYGWEWEHLEKIRQMDGVLDAEEVQYLDLITRMDGSEEDTVYRFLAIPETINKVALRGGRMPEAPNECLVEGFHMSDSILGRTVTIQLNNEEESLESVTEDVFTVVGYVATPLYMDMNRGTTSVGNGNLTGFFYVQPEALDMDYVPEINITVSGDYDIYTKEYNDSMDQAADALEARLQVLADERLKAVRSEAQKEYQDGLQEYRDGLKEYNEKKADVDKELADAYKELQDAEKEIENNEQLLKDGEDQIAQARVTLSQSELTLAQSRTDAYAQMAEANNELMENYKTVSGSLREVENGKLELEMGLIQIESGITQLESGITQIDSGVQQLEMMIGLLDISIEALESTLEGIDKTEDLFDITIPEFTLPDFSFDAFMASTESTAETEPSVQIPDIGISNREDMEKQLEELKAQREDYETQLEDVLKQREELTAQLEELQKTKEELEAQKLELDAAEQQLEDGMAAIEEGFLELAAAQLQMDNQFAAAESQIEAGYSQLDAREKEIANGKIRLEEGKQELADGWIEYEDGKKEAEQEFADAWQELQDGKEALRDAKKWIDAMTENEIIILDRQSNAGYNNLESSSDIVQGVSRVLPVFFILVASLVCITTMTRMIDEERTQIGTLKALGYSNAAIIGKYMFYSGSGAIIGCLAGVTIGSTIFPMILWEAYKIMLYISPTLVLTVNWWLCIAVVAVYTGVMLFVTWYCCRKTLREEPAELIRPKAPEAGKKILIEYLPFWHNISFLNKVTIRNIFRYRQRLAMMLVGIGGCTALLVTGFGLRDSIVNIVDFQFENITLYDMQVYFRGEVTDETIQDFREEIGTDTPYLLYHQSSVELEADDRVKEILMISANDKITEFIDLHSGEKALSLPGANEVVLSVGVTESMGIAVGDTVIIRNSDMQMLELRVSGIYDNHVNNYCLVSPQTIANQWGLPPEEQMALVKIQDDRDLHILAADLSEMPDIMSVSISEDMADMVRNMMDALDLVIVVVMVCAGLLAITVLYNLTNININERVREIATIKVLGFNANETGAYVFKENMILTVAGSLIGLVLGKLMLLFVMTQIKIDAVWFKAVIMPNSYLISAVLTLFAAVIVDFVFYFKLQKINMAEALKSVE